MIVIRYCLVLKMHFSLPQFFLHFLKNFFEVLSVAVFVIREADLLLNIYPSVIKSLSLSLALSLSLPPTLSLSLLY